MFLIIILFFISSVCFSESLERQFSLEVFYGYAEKLSKFQTVDTQKIPIDVNGQQFEYFSSSIKEFKSKFYSNQTGVSLKFNVTEKIFYKFSIASLSSSKMNFLEEEDYCSNKMGFKGDLNFSYSVFPNTIVTPSIDLVAEVSWISCDLDSIYTENNIFRVNFTYKVLDYCLGLKVEKNFGFFEIFLLPNVIYRETSLTNKTNLYTVEGKNTLFNFTLGNKFYLTKKDLIGFEISHSIDFDREFDFYTKVFLNIVF